jgi:hypothetical protein
MSRILWTIAFGILWGCCSHAPTPGVSNSATVIYRKQIAPNLEFTATLDRADDRLLMLDGGKAANDVGPVKLFRIKYFVCFPGGMPQLEYSDLAWFLEHESKADGFFEILSATLDGPTLVTIIGFDGSIQVLAIELTTQRILLDWPLSAWDGIHSVPRRIRPEAVKIQLTGHVADKSLAITVINKIDPQPLISVYEYVEGKNELRRVQGWGLSRPNENGNRKRDITDYGE